MIPCKYVDEHTLPNNWNQWSTRSEDFIMLRSFVLTQYRRVTLTDRQTELQYL